MTRVQAAAQREMERIARSISDAQDRKGMSDREVAEAVGISRRQYINYRQGKLKNPNADILSTLEDVLDVDLNDTDHSHAGSEALPHTAHTSPGEGRVSFKVKSVMRNDDEYELAENDETSPVAFDESFVERHLVRAGEEGFEMEATMASYGEDFYPGQRVWVAYTHNRVPAPDKYVVKVGDSWGIYDVQRRPKHTVRFKPVGKSRARQDPFDLEVRDDETVKADDVKVVGRIVGKLVTDR